MKILWPENCAHHPLAGGKAKTLAKLADRFPVPQFFCVPADQLMGWKNAPPDDGILSLRAAYDALLGDGSFASVSVRSSAIDEDGVYASFAGQYTTVLNVVTFDGVLDATHRCVASALSENIATYRNENETTEKPHMAVIVQKQIFADAAAVAFSADPTTGERGKVIINAVWGLGEGVVSGIVNPDIYVFENSKNDIQVHLGEKEKMIVAAGEETQTVKVPETLRSYPALTLSQVERIAEMATTLEKDQGYPVDIECCIQNDVLYLLQCRPITALAHPGQMGS